MPVIFLTSTLIIINIVFWIVFLAKFKKIFSTEDILLAVRNELDKMIADVNRNTARDLNLIDAKLKDLKLAVSETDRHLAVAKAEIEKQQQLARFSQQFDYQGSSFGKGSAVQEAVGKYQKNITDSLFPREQDAYSEQIRLRERAEPQMQSDLFNYNKNETIEPQIKSRSGTYFSVKKDDDMPSVSYAKEPVLPKKDFRTMVMDLYNMGNSVETIANELGRTTTEVQLVIDMSF